MPKTYINKHAQTVHLDLTSKLCKGINKKGEPCKSFVYQDKEFCVKHDPDRIDLRKSLPLFHFRLPSDLLKTAEKQSGIIPLSVIIRRLIEMWLNGEVQITISATDETNLQD